MQYDDDGRKKDSVTLSKRASIEYPIKLERQNKVEVSQIYFNPINQSIFLRIYIPTVLTRSVILFRLLGFSLSRLGLKISSPEWLILVESAGRLRGRFERSLAQGQVQLRLITEALGREF